MPNDKNMLMMTPAERDALARMQMNRGSMIQPVMIAKAGTETGDNSAFAKLAPPYDKITYADKIAGATKKMKGGPIGGMPLDELMKGGPNGPMLPGGMPEYKKRGEVKATKYYKGGGTYGRRRS